MVGKDDDVELLLQSIALAVQDGHCAGVSKGIAKLRSQVLGRASWLNDATLFRRLTEVVWEAIAFSTPKNPTEGGEMVIVDAQMEANRHRLWQIASSLLGFRYESQARDIQVSSLVSLLEKSFALKCAPLVHYQNATSNCIIFMKAIDRSIQLIYESSIVLNLVWILDRFAHNGRLTDKIMRILRRFRCETGFGKMLKSIGILGPCKKILERGFSDRELDAIGDSVFLMCSVFADEDEQILIDMVRGVFGPICKILEQHLIIRYDIARIWWIIAILSQPDAAKPYMTIFLPYAIDAFNWTWETGEYEDLEHMHLSILRTLYELSHFPGIHAEFFKMQHWLPRAPDFYIEKFGSSSIEAAQLAMGLRATLGSKYATDLIDPFSPFGFVFFRTSAPPGEVGEGI